MKIAIIGTRRPDTYQKELAKRWAAGLSTDGYRIATGGALGIDSIVLRNTLVGLSELYLPWEGYNKNINQCADKVIIFDRTRDVDWLASVNAYHPAPQRLTQQAVLLHARNYGIVHDADLVLAFPQKGMGGGTGQGIRIAKSMSKPLLIVETGATVWMGKNADAWLGRLMELAGDEAVRNTKLEVTNVTQEG